MKIFSKCFWLGHKIEGHDTSHWTDYGYEHDGYYDCAWCDWFNEFAEYTDTIPDWFIAKYRNFRNKLWRLCYDFHK